MIEMDEKNIDISLKRLFKDQLPKERKDEWFVRKTMNRLPERRRPTFSVPEIVSYVLSALILLSGWVWLWARFNHEDSLTYGSLMMGGVLMIASFSLLGAVMYPIIKRG